MDEIIRKLETFEEPSTLLWRGIELKFVKMLLDKYPVTGKSLDLGCGEGKVAEAVFEKQISVGLDNGPEMVRKATINRIYKKVVLGDAAKMPFENQSFDFIFSNSVVEHIEDIEGVLSEMKRVLKKDGIIILTVPNNYLTGRSIFSALGLRGISRWYGEKRNKKFDHFNLWNRETWGKKLEKNGMRIVEPCSYLSKQETEYWDFLLMLFFVLKKINGKLAVAVYKFLRNRIWRVISKAEACETGSASCIVIGHSPQIRS